MLHVEQLFVFFAGSIEKYNISFNIKIIKCIKCISCVRLNSVMNDCYNSKNQLQCLFCGGSLLLSIRRYTPDMWPGHIGVRRSRTYEVGLKFIWDSKGTCHIAINISRKDTNEFQKGVWHRCLRYAFDMFAREFHMSVQKCKKNYVITQ